MSFTPSPSLLSRTTPSPAQPKPQVDEFVKLRAPIRNLVATIGDWNLACNNRTDVFKDHSCYNNVKHRKLAHFKGRCEWEDHVSKCYDHVRSTSTRRK